MSMGLHVMVPRAFEETAMRKTLFALVLLPPVLISLPFKLLLFVAADGWYLVVQSLVRSFHT